MLHLELFLFGGCENCGILIQIDKGMLMMKYTVKRIDEDLDFGCEERIEGTLVMAVVTLVDEEAHEMRLRVPDQMLYSRDINEGDVVYLDERREVRKV